jgi:hypothetical protein
MVVFKATMAIKYEPSCGAMDVITDSSNIIVISGTEDLTGYLERASRPKTEESNCKG